MHLTHRTEIKLKTNLNLSKEKTKEFISKKIIFFKHSFIHSITHSFIGLIFRFSLIWLNKKKKRKKLEINEETEENDIFVLIKKILEIKVFFYLFIATFWIWKRDKERIQENKFLYRNKQTKAKAKQTREMMIKKTKINKNKNYNCMQLIWTAS